MIRYWKRNPLETTKRRGRERERDKGKKKKKNPNPNVFDHPFFHSKVLWKGFRSNLEYI
jgi:hypothetical protein